MKLFDPFAQPVSPIAESEISEALWFGLRLDFVRPRIELVQE